MSSRPLVVMAALLALIAAPAVGQPAGVAAPEPPLPGENSISNVVVEQNADGVWQASFDYYYTGEPRFVVLAVDLGEGVRILHEAPQPGTSPFLERGAHSVTINVPYPLDDQLTRRVFVHMREATRGPEPERKLVTVQVERVIEWPDFTEWTNQKEFVRRSPQENLERAIELIDAGGRDDLEQARSMLEKLIERDPSLVQGYIELGRVAMKSNWGPEGLRHAEGLLSSALQLAPQNANAKILLGYVYAHQERHQDAEKLFADAAASNPRNLWLWTNWGEVLAMQGKFEHAAAKYQEAVARPMTHDTYDRAREEAYRRLFVLLERKQDLDGLEELHKKSVTEFGRNSCFSLAYADFLLERRGDAAAAIQSARTALKARCAGRDGRQLLGLAHYLAWSQSKGPARVEALSQARIYLPAGPMPLYLLARSEKTVDVARQLLAAGERIDQTDNDKLNALAHAIQSEDAAAARRLLSLGAKPEATVGFGDVPVALMPVFAGDVEMIRLMQEFGADYGKISYEGATAFDFAEAEGDSELKAVLSGKTQTL